MGLMHFCVRESFEQTACRIHVEPAARRCDVVVTVGGRIVCVADETNPTFRSLTPTEWYDPPTWARKARAIAAQQSKIVGESPIPTNNGEQDNDH
jgi:hypothetical protein